MHIDICTLEGTKIPQKSPKKKKILFFIYFLIGCTSGSGKNLTHIPIFPCQTLRREATQGLILSSVTFTSVSSYSFIACTKRHAHKGLPVIYFLPPCLKVLHLYSSESSERCWRYGTRNIGLSAKRFYTECMNPWWKLTLSQYYKVPVSLMVDYPFVLIWIRLLQSD